MNDKSYSSEKLSFWQLIQKAEIEIPIIQRDYAQGRDEKKKIRENFLSALKGAVQGNPVELDFIYGTKKADTLQPLDGQQRLTTLFLLHWYFAAKNKVLTPDVQDNLNKFTYETRLSSRRFCNALVSKSISFDQLLPADKGKENGLSNTIKDTSWFSLTWKQDPTIKAMLTMLDAIHNIFSEVNDGWSKLTNKQDRAITFQYIELSNLGLTDDLYIKMNARGKQLSPFENFKAIFEKEIDEKKWENGLPIIERFSHKVDTVWTDIFWNSSNPDTFDSAYIKFMANAAMVSIALRSGAASDKQDRTQLIQDLYNNAEELNPSHYDMDAYNYLYDSLEAYSKIDPKSLTFEIPFWQLLKKGENIFDKITLDKAPTYQQRILFMAQTEFLIKGGSAHDISFQYWMRVIRNIVLNATIDSAETYSGAASLIKELSNGYQNIYDHLATQPILSSFASSQVKEEVKKAKLIQADNNNASVLFEAEDKNFFKGKVSFALYCVDYLKAGDDLDRSKLSNINTVVAEHLNNEDVSNEFRRALLTINDHKFYKYWWSWLYVVEAVKRKLIANTDDLRYIADQVDFKDYLKVLLNQLVEESLDSLLVNFQLPDGMPNWKKQLIKEPSLLEYSQQHYIAIPEDDSCCYMIPQSKVANNKDGRKKLLKVV